MTYSIEWPAEGSKWLTSTEPLPTIKPESNKLYRALITPHENHLSMCGPADNKYLYINNNRYLHNGLIEEVPLTEVSVIIKNATGKRSDRELIQKHAGTRFVLHTVTKTGKYKYKVGMSGKLVSLSADNLDFYFMQRSIPNVGDIIDATIEYKGVKAVVTSTLDGYLGCSELNTGSTFYAKTYDRILHRPMRIYTNGPVASWLARQLDTTVSRRKNTRRYKITTDTNNYEFLTIGGGDNHTLYGIVVPPNKKAKFEELTKTGFVIDREEVLLVHPKYLKKQHTGAPEILVRGSISPDMLDWARGRDGGG